MSKMGPFTDQPKQRLHRLLALQGVWIVTVLALGTWWGSLILKHARRIEELEIISGIFKPGNLEGVQSTWMRTQRMVYWEMGFFFLLLLLISFLLVVIYWRDFLRSRAIQAFFASLTHELKTPLTSIRLQAESLPSDSHLVKRLLEDTTRLESQVERTLELARLEGGGKVSSQPMDLKLWLDRNLPSWREAYDKRLDLIVNVSATSLNVLANPHSLQIIFRNLIENSVKHSGQEPVQIKIEWISSEKNPVLSIRDNGISAKKTKLHYKKLGGLFEKGIDSHGAGVGLYLVQSLMKHMGGKAQFHFHENGFETRLAFLEDKT